MDITTTIDVDMADIAEKALTDKLKEIEAQTGYAVLMEVATMELKPLSICNATPTAATPKIKTGLYTG